MNGWTSGSSSGETLSSSEGTSERSGARQRFPLGIVWLRRDLRLDDHTALAAAAERCERVVCAFVLDPPLLRGPRVGAPIVQFFFSSLAVLRDRLRADGSDLALLEGDFADELGTLARRTGAAALFYNEDYEPSARERDAAVTRALSAAGISVFAFTDHVYAGANALLQSGGKPYVVFTPYRRRWDQLRENLPHPPIRSLALARDRFASGAAIGATRAVPRPEDYGHAASDRYPAGGIDAAQRALTVFVAGPIAQYADGRNRPALDATSHLSPHLRAGTIGIRTCVAAAHAVRASGTAATGRTTWVSELTWRDFYQQLLYHEPRVAVDPFLIAGTAIAYREDEAALQAWIDGRTGYPIVDAAMRQLNTTGWMHNRLRMIVASFFTKHLLLDYRLGERYFEQHLADADLAANNGGWQWSASVGTDAAPYFRVFNPTLQGKTFDPDGAFVRQMLPELARVPERYVHEPWTMPPLVAEAAGCTIGRDYPAPIVDHRDARRRALSAYGAVLARKPAAR